MNPKQSIQFINVTMSVYTIEPFLLPKLPMLEDNSAY